MLRFELAIDLDNAAFADGQHRDEIARILGTVINKLQDGRALSGALHDANGNRVGWMEIKRLGRRFQ